MKPILRPATPADAGAVAAIYAPFCGADSVASFETEAPTPEAMAERIAKTTAQLPWLVAADDSGIRGYVYASRHRERGAYRWSVDVTAYLRADSRGQGLGTALYTALFEILRAQGYFKAYAGITLPNPASVGLHAALGFTQVGIYHGVGFRAGAWRDVSWWELALRPEVPDPPEPRPLPAVLGAPAWSSALASGAARLEAAAHQVTGAPFRPRPGP